MTNGVAQLLDLPGIETARLTCEALPVQIEGKFSSGYAYYFRYRFGWAGMGIGKTISQAIADQRRDIQHGDKLQGSFDTTEEMLEVFTACWEKTVTIDRWQHRCFQGWWDE